MRMPGRISAAIEILEDIFAHHLPVGAALSEWAKAHRFAGSGDRAVIGNLVYDVVRQKASLKSFAGSDAPRSLVLAALKLAWNKSADEIAALCDEKFGPGALSGTELDNLLREPDADSPPWILGDYPEWLQPSFERAFGMRAACEGAALSKRAPVDLRVNTLKCTPDKLCKALSRLKASQGPFSPIALRLPVACREGRNASAETEPEHGKGWFEIQDAGSQVAALLSGAKPGMQVADICAGAGGKTLALAAMMENKGQLYAHDSDKHRLRPIFERLKRAGARNVQVVAASEAARLHAMTNGLDIVFVDAPCSGSGAWRRKPDTKWRLTAETLARRIADQRALLDQAATLVRPGGRLVYVTCSVLPEENSDQIKAFMQRNAGFQIAPYGNVWQETISTDAPPSADGSKEALLLTPALHKTDGFFVAILTRDFTTL